MKTNLLAKIPLRRRFVASDLGFRPTADTAQAPSLDVGFQSTARRKCSWLALASVLLAFTSFASAQNADLSSLVPSAGTLDPAFDSATITYTASVPFATASITVTPTVAEVGATVTVNTIPVASGAASDPIALSVGPNVITTEVTSADLSTTKTYTLTVTRAAASTNADLSGLVPSAGTLNPVFDSGTIAYAATVQFSTSSMTVTPTKADANATITVNGNPVASGSPSAPIALSLGANVISTVVTAEDGSTTKTYTLTVTRVAADLVTDFQATISSQINANATGEGKYYHVSLSGPNPGTGSFCANIPGTNNPAPPFVRNYDGPVEAYKWAGGTNNVITAVSRSGGNAGSITFATDDTAFDTFGQDVAKLWTTTDPGSDIKVGQKLSASPDTTATGWRDLGGAVCTIDVTSVSAGSVHFYYGNYNGKPKVSVVMRDTDGPEPDLTIAEAHLNGDSANSGEFYLAEIDFDTNGTYDEIEIFWDANGDGSTATGNGRGIGVVVTSSVADAVDPTLVPADIVDNVSGGPFTSTGASITYTVTYSELMDPATIDASDFSLTGTAAASINSVVHYGGVTTVVVTPTAGTSGTLVLQVNASAVLADLAGNPLDTTAAIADDPAVTIVADATPPTLVSITDNVSGGPILEGQTVVYTVTFDEPIKATSIGTDDFENGGSPAATISSVNATANPAVYNVVASAAYPGGVGTLLLQIKSGAVIEDLSGNPLDTTSALTGGGATITVNAQDPTRLVATIDLPFTSGENSSATLNLTYDASGSDKLVIIATKEGNGNPFTTLTYEGQPLILAVGTGSTAGGQHFNGIYYLDNPGNYNNGTGAVGEIVATSGTSRNIITAIGLSDTAPGFGGSAAPAAPDNSKTVNLPVNFVGSMVIASHGMGQDGNTANVTSVNTNSPLTEMSALETGNNWVGHVTGYAASQGPGLITYGFNGGSTTGVNTIAVEFPGALVSTGSPYTTWASTNAPSPQTPDQDYDGDGVSNAVEFVLGGLATTNDLDKLPTAATSGSDMTFTFERDETSVDASTGVTIEVSNDLVNWNAGSSPYAVPDSATGPVNPGVTVVDNGSTHTVTLTIPQAPDTKKFARLKVAITP